MRIHAMGLCLMATIVGAPASAQVSSPATLQTNVVNSGFYEAQDVLGDQGNYRRTVDGDEGGWQSLDRRRALWNARLRADRLHRNAATR